jgi:hypothetical protein
MRHFLPTTKEPDRVEVVVPLLWQCRILDPLLVLASMDGRAG